MKGQYTHIYWLSIITVWWFYLNDIIDVCNYNKHLSIHQFLILKRFARIGDTSIHYILFVIILLTDLDWIYINEPGRSTVCRFGISSHDSIIQYQTRKSYSTRMPETISIRSNGC